MDNDKELIVIFCEYDIDGQFDSGRTLVMTVDVEVLPHTIDALALDLVMKVTGQDAEELNRLYSWEYLDPSELKLIK